MKSPFKRGHWILEGREVKEVDLYTWAAWLEDDINKRRVAHTTIGQIEVYTTFIGIDMGWGGKAPLLFETMSFDLDGDGAKQVQRRWATYTEAELGHKATVLELQGAPVT